MINDLLKKYEKEFNHFAQLYQNELETARRLKIRHHQEEDRRENDGLLEDTVRRLKQVLGQQEETVEILKGELERKEGQGNQMNQEVEERNQLAEKYDQLQKRYSELAGQLDSLRKRILTTSSEIEDGELEGKSVPYLVTLLRTKDQEIVSLSHVYHIITQYLDEKNKQLEDLSSRFTQLQEKLRDQPS